jgi:hypothetical protein
VVTSFFEDFGLAIGFSCDFHLVPDNSR